MLIFALIDVHTFDQKVVLGILLQLQFVVFWQEGFYTLCDWGVKIVWQVWLSRKKHLKQLPQGRVALKRLLRDILL